MEGGREAWGRRAACEGEAGQAKARGTYGRSEEARIRVNFVEEEEGAKSPKLETHEGEEENVDTLKQQEILLADTADGLHIDIA